MGSMDSEQTARSLEKALADDERTHELGVHIHLHGDRLIAQGEVASQERRETVVAVLRELAPDAQVSDQLTVSADGLRADAGHEHITSESAPPA